jgi:hypothetical protein
MTPDAADSQIQWEEPPPDGRRTGWAKIPDELRAHPGEWAKFGGIKTPTTVAYLRRRWFPSPDFEVVARSAGNGQTNMYARYIGGAS